MKAHTVDIRKDNTRCERCGASGEELNKLTCPDRKLSQREQERKEAIEHLRKIIKPGDTVYTILRHVSRSGMTRGIDVYILQPVDVDERVERRRCEPIWITSYVGKAIDQRQPEDYWRKSMGLKIGGCGMDMGFHVVNSLQYALFGVPTKDNPKPGELRHQWL